VRGKKKLIIIPIVVVLVVVIVILNIRREKGGVRIQTAKVTNADIVSEVSAPGKVEPVTRVQVSAYVMGRVVELPVREGDWVDEGDVLVEIDPVNYQALVAQARASLELSQARLRQTEQSLQRTRELFARDLISKEELERVETDWSVQRAQVARDQAALHQALDQLSKTTIRSPLSGVVTQLNVEQGEVVVTGTMNMPGSVIMTVANLSEMKVEVEVDETEVRDIMPGQEVEIAVDALGDTSLIGIVETVGEAGVETMVGGEPQTNFEVSTLLNKVPPKLRPGMSAVARIKTASRKDVRAVPISAVILRDWEREIEQAESRSPGRRSGGREATEQEESPGEQQREEGAREPEQEGIVEEPVQEQSTEQAGEGDAPSAEELVSGQAGGESTAETAETEGTAEETEPDSTAEEKVGEVEVVYVVQDGKAIVRRVETGIRDDNNIEILSGLELDEEVVTGPFRVLRTLKHETRVKVDNSLVREMGDRGGRRQ
jgi:HlyD family secretion protein